MAATGILVSTDFASLFAFTIISTTASVPGALLAASATALVTASTIWPFVTTAAAFPFESIFA
jgi:hypothetical protein